MRWTNAELGSLRAPGLLTTYKRLELLSGDWFLQMDWADDTSVNLKMYLAIQAWYVLGNSSNARC